MSLILYGHPFSSYTQKVLVALYEQYRSDSMQDAECQAAFRYAEETRCIVSYERSFFRPVFA